MELTKKEATVIARKVAKANTALWNVIGMIEELVTDERVRELTYSLDEDVCEQCEVVANVYNSLKKNDDAFISASLYQSCFDDFDSLAIRLQEYIDKMETE